MSRTLSRTLFYHFQADFAAAAIDVTNSLLGYHELSHELSFHFQTDFAAAAIDAKTGLSAGLCVCVCVCVCVSVCVCVCECMCVCVHVYRYVCILCLPRAAGPRRYGLQVWPLEGVPHRGHGLFAKLNLGTPV